MSEGETYVFLFLHQTENLEISPSVLVIYIDGRNMVLPEYEILNEGKGEEGREGG